MVARPSGVVTFLFTDIQGSTRLWDLYPEAMKQALVVHDEVIRGAIERRGGYVFATSGDGFAAAFSFPEDALGAALEAQSSLALHTWAEAGPLGVRLAVHAGVAEEREGNYFGATVNRCARLLAASHGGQIVLSQAASDLVSDSLPAGVTLRDLGRHRLRDLARPERVFQVIHPDLPSEFPQLRTLDAFPNNLPVQLTSFVGRKQELAEVAKLLHGARLVTLTGPGGSGKTRLALQAAAEAVESHPDGVWVVELASLTDPAVLPRAVAAATGVRAVRGRPLMTSIMHHLEAQSALLVVDGCEHLAESVARLLAQLLATCPLLRVLATSQELLGAAGEVAYRVPALALPGFEEARPGQLQRYDAIRLFTERAGAAYPAFRVTGENGAAVAEICRRLDGMPLAIELAAARVRMLTPAQIAGRLDERFRLLTRAGRGPLPRQRTLEAAIDWSVALLDDRERSVFERLSVFSGGFTLEAAEAVCVGSGVEDLDILDLLSRLMDKSLVTAHSPSGDPGRYRLLETLQHYASRRLTDTGHLEEARRLHAEFFRHWAMGMEPKLRGPQQVQSFAEMEVEHDNLRAALRWLLEKGESEGGLQLAGTLWWFWVVRGHWSEGREWLEKMLADESGSAPARARALHALGVLSDIFQPDRRTRLLEEELTLRRELEDEPGIVATLNNLAMVAIGQGDYQRAGSLLEEGLTLARKSGAPDETLLLNLGFVAVQAGDYRQAEALYGEGLAHSRDRGDQVSVASALLSFGYLARVEAQLERAGAFLEEGLSILRRLGFKQQMAQALGSLALVAQDQGDLARAAGLLAESLPMIRELDDRESLARWLEISGSTQLALGRPERAVRLFGAADSLFEDLGLVRWATDRPAHQHNVASMRNSLGGEAFDQGWAEGRSMTVEEAIAAALDEPDAD